MSRAKKKFDTQPSRPELEIFCFGGFRIHWKGRLLRLKNKKARELLALLACELGRPVSKRRAASLLWDVGAEQGRDSLSKVCSAIRGFSREHGNCIPMTSAYGELCLDFDHVWCDLAEFRDLSGQQGAESWRKAVLLHTGELLLSDCFEWTEEYAGRCEIEYLELCRRLAEHYREQGMGKLAKLYEQNLL